MSHSGFGIAFDIILIMSTVPQSGQTTASFAATRWTLVLAAGEGADQRHADALEELCQAYWQPIYAYIRHCGQPRSEAEDLTQGFFARLIEHSDLSAADPSRGRFRAFLMACLRNFMANQHDREIAAKRGGRVHITRLEFGNADQRYQREPAHDLTPDKLFERRWAMTVLDRVMTQLREYYSDAGKLPLFEALKPLLTKDDGEKNSCADIAAHLGTTSNAVKTAAYRLRTLYRQTLRAQIAETVATEEEIDQEIRHLLAVLGTQ
jgi:RNA polymerase sigma-70 factor (ECF subfamily)